MGFISFIGFIVLLIWCSKLSNRLSALENKNAKNVPAHTPSSVVPAQPSVSVQSPHAVISPPIVVAPVGAQNEVTDTTPEIQRHHETVPVSQGIVQPLSVQHVAQQPLADPVATFTPAQIQHAPTKPDPVLAWLKENTLIKIGAFLFFLGAVWFVSYAISEGWISELMRILMGILLGVVVCAVGVWRKKDSVENYLVLTTLGVGIVIASIYTGQMLFDIFLPAFALVLLCGAIAYAVWVSITSKTEWLSVVSVITACIAPLMVHAPQPDAVAFLSYLLVMSCAFLTVVFFTHWRSVTLTLVLGVSFFELSLHAGGIASTEVFLFFAPVFTVLFFGASTLSMFKSNTPWNQDLTALSIVSGMAVWWAHTFAPALDGLVLFLFALLCAYIGFVFHMHQKSQRLISIYAGLASVFILIATSLTFDGFALTMIYTFEIGFAIILAIHLHLTERLIRLASFTFILPIALSFGDMASSEWSQSVLHPSAFTLYVLTAVTLVISSFAFENWRKDSLQLHHNIGVLFLALFGFYAYICSWLICSSLFSAGASTITACLVLWVVISAFLVTNVLSLHLSTGIFRLAFASFLLPVFLSLGIVSLHSVTWISPSLLGLYFMTGVSLVLAVGLITLSTSRADKNLVSAGGIAVCALWFYAMVSIAQMGGVFTDNAVQETFRYVGWALVSVSLAGMLLALKTPIVWVTASLCTLALVFLSSQQSFFVSEWRDSLLHAHAYGLYLLLVIFLYTAVFLRHVGQHNTEHGALLLGHANKLFVVSGLYSAVLVWLIADALFDSPDVSVSVALFVYTVTGLCLYTLGRVHDIKALRKAGIIVLSGVVARLLIVDVWGMEILGRIFTFLGVGLLFILTALFEKPFQKLGKGGGE